MRCLAVLAVVWATVPAFGQTSSEKKSTILQLHRWGTSGFHRGFGAFHFVEERVSDAEKDAQGDGYRFLSEKDFRGPEGLIVTRCWWSMTSDNRLTSVSCVFEEKPGTEPIFFLMSVRNAIGSGIILGDNVLFVEAMDVPNDDEFALATRFRNQQLVHIASFPEYHFFTYGLGIKQEQPLRATMAMVLSTTLVNQMALYFRQSGISLAPNSPEYSLPLTHCPPSTQGSIEGHSTQLKELEATEWEALLQAHDRNVCIDRAGQPLIDRQPERYREVIRGFVGLGLTLADTSSAQNGQEAFSRYSLAFAPNIFLGFSRGPMRYLAQVGLMGKAHRFAPGEPLSVLLAFPLLRGQVSYTFLRLKYMEGVAGLSLQVGMRGPLRAIDESTSSWGAGPGLATGPVLGLHLPLKTPFLNPQSRVVLSVDAIPQVGFWSPNLRTEFGVQVLTGIRIE